MNGAITSIIAVLGDILQFIEQVNKIENECTKIEDKTRPAVFRDKGGDCWLNCDIKCVEDILLHLNKGNCTYQIMEAALQAIAGYFYSSDDIYHGVKMKYFQQGEWRIIANMIDKDGEISKTLTHEQRASIIKIDEEWFSEEVQMRKNILARIDHCQLYKNLNRKHVLNYANRIIVPENVLDDAQKIIREFGFRIEVIPIESLLE